MTLPQPRESIVRVDSPTEQRNPGTEGIDRLPTVDVLRMINSEDHLVPGAVADVLPQVARAVDHAVATLRSGGRVHYVGAGTSGRLATLDAAELLPTFNTPADWFVAHHAGGATALRVAVENAEDDFDAGAAEIRDAARPTDVVFGITASGRTPFVLGALAAGNEVGARTVLLSANPGATPSVPLDVLIAVNTGPEVIAGSTRMKAGTAQKMVLNMLSTATMVRLGKTFGNLMVDVRATNEKLRERALSILAQTTGLPRTRCEEQLAAANGELKTAILSVRANLTPVAARERLARHDGVLRVALEDAP